MYSPSWKITGFIALLFVTFYSVSSASASGSALGPRLGWNKGLDEFFIGGQAEFGRILGTATFVPSLDFGFGGTNQTIANLDLRWYILPLPETGIRIYGSAGPTIVFSGDNELGLSLTAGLNIPMQSRRRYNLEFRFGIGDIPDLKIALAVMFGI